MDEPLVGTRENNYRFFYVASGAAITSVIFLLVITGYTAFTATHVGHLMTGMSEVVEDIRVILPDVEDSIKLLRNICKHENFTKSYGNICD
jgi:hypothetical protein